MANEQQLAVEQQVGVAEAGSTVIGVQYVGLTTDEVKALFATLQHEKQPKVWNGRYPYRGLSVFQEKHAPYFFGREELVTDLLQHVRNSHFITIAGPSGSGKSSVARAGLFHALRTGERIEHSDSWLFATMQPENNPIEQLAIALERMTNSATIGDAIREDPQTFQRQIAMRLSDDKDERFILLVDQFEEIFTQTKNLDRRTTFINLLTAAASAPKNRIIIVLCMRSDFISRCAAYPDLRRLMSQQLQLVGAMSPEELLKAITLPALEVGAEIDPELVSRIIADMKGEPGALPLMSFALRELFEKEKSEKGQPMDLTLPEYFEIGGIERALKRHAEKVFKNFTPEQENLAKNIFSKLIDVGQERVNTRRIVPFSELIPANIATEKIKTIVLALAEENVRLITTSRGSLETAVPRTVTIAHEKLIDAWPWLRNLVEERREIIGLQNKIDDDAQAWNEKQDSGFLYRGGRLLQIEERLEDLTPLLSTLSYNFVQTSIKQRRQEEEAKKAQQQRELIQAQQLAEEQRQRAIAEKLKAEAQEKRAIAQEQRAEAEKRRAEEQEKRVEAERQRVVVEQERSSLFRRALVIIGFLLLIAATTAVSASAARSRAEENEKRAIAQTTVNAAQSLQRANQLQTSTLLAITSWENDQLPAAAEILRQNLTKLPFAVETLTEAEAEVRDVAFSDDGVLLAVGMDNGEAFIWETATSKKVETLDHENDSVFTIAFSPDGTLLATGGHDGAFLWGVETGNQQAELAHDDQLLDVVFSPDGQLLATASWDGTARLWDVTSEKQVHLFDNLGDRVADLAFSSDGRKLITGGAAGHIWDVATGKELAVLPHDSYLLSVAFSPDGTLAATASTDHIAAIWDVASGHRLHAFQHKGRAEDVVFSPSGEWVAIASEDNRIRLWHLPTEQETQVRHDGAVTRLAFSSDSKWLASTSDDQTARLWDMTTGAEQGVMALGGKGSGVEFQANGRLLATITSSGNTHLWDITPITPEHQIIVHKNVVTNAVFHPAGNSLATVSRDFNTRLWNIPNEATADFDPAVQTFAGHNTFVNDVAVSHDGMWLATASDDGSTVIWAIASGKEVRRLSEEEGALVTSVAFSPDGTQIITGNAHGWATIWDTTTGDVVEALQHGSTNIFGSGPDVVAVAFAPDGSSVATGTSDGFVRIWSKSGRRQVTLEHGEETITAVTYTHDGTWLATASVDGFVRLWKTADMNNLSPFNESEATFFHPDVVLDIAFNSTGEQLATASGDGFVRLWDVTLEQELARIAHETAVSSVAFSPNDSLLLTTSSIATRLWQLEDILLLRQDQLTDEACTRVTDNLSEAEWAEYVAGDEGLFSNYTAFCNK